MAGLNAYSRFDRLVHRLAFAAPGVQLAAADIEDGMFKADLAEVESGPPVFITSLPRAGTTILLEALARVPELSTHIYRDMPFVMAPMLWARLSRSFRKEARLEQRAHGDGIEIGFDSPEAFEEIIWRAFWPAKFTGDHIALSGERDVNDEARTFLLKHFAKIVTLRIAGSAPKGRYLSKNNGNISRLGLIGQMFPEARIIVPMRHPLTHAASLHRQHLRFVERHAEDAFAKRYMRDIGHYEFGDLHRPILFEGFRDLSRGLTPADLDYWFAYWIAAFRHVRSHRDGLSLLGYERLCENGSDTGTRLCALLGLDPAQAAAIGSVFRPAPEPDAALAAHRSPLRDEAEALHAELLALDAGTG